MQHLNLKGRLSCCARLVREGSRLADIGTDHAYLPISLCLSDRIPSALACDINPLPLKSAREHIASYGLCDRIATRLSDGLKEVGATEADDIVIAGMGGELIAAILGACPWAKDGEKRFILQPMTRHEALIRFLYANGYAILRQEAVLDDKKYYTVILAAYDGTARDCDDYTAHVGKLTPDNEASVGFLTKCLNQLRKKAVGDPSLAPTADRIEELLS
jgi:tRNA (adenine22-N1)-methyltransferase